MSAHPSYPTFAAKDDFKIFLERLEIAFAINKTTESDKSSILLNQVDEIVYKTLRNLCAPTIPGEEKFSELCRLLQRQYISETSAWKERRKFFNAVQRRGERVNDWYLRLKTLSTGCQFGEELQEMLKCKFICGLASPMLFEIVGEQQKTISLEDVLRITMNQEDTVKPVTKPAPVKTSDMKSFELEKKVLKDPNTDNNTEKRCEVCGSSWHDSFACQHKNSTCKTCKQVGHIQRVCLHKNSKDKQIADKSICRYCGEGNHLFVKCSHRSSECERCGKVGHAVKVCRRSPTDTKGSSKQNEPEKNLSSKYQQKMIVCQYCGEGNHLFITCSHRSSNCERCGKVGHAVKVCRLLPTDTQTNLKQKEPETNFSSKNQQELFTSLKCAHCGETNHKSIFCEHKFKRCENCNKTGHLKQMCTVYTNFRTTPATSSYMPGKTQNLPQNRNKKSTYVCVHCGMADHISEICRYKYKTCSKCLVVGHTEPVCQNKSEKISNKKKDDCCIA